MAQGKAWNKEIILEALEPYLRMGYPINKACNLIGVPPTTVITWYENDESLRVKIYSWVNSVNDKARKVIVNAIDNGDTGTARWYAERKMKDEFSVRNELVGADGESLKLDILTDEEKDADKLTAQAKGSLDEYL